MAIQEILISVVAIVIGAGVIFIVKAIKKHFSSELMAEGYNSQFSLIDKELREFVKIHKPNFTFKEFANHIRNNTKGYFVCLAVYKKFPDRNLILESLKERTIQEELVNNSDLKFFTQATSGNFGKYYNFLSLLGDSYFKLLEEIDSYSGYFNAAKKKTLIKQTLFCDHQNYLLYLYLCLLVDKDKYHRYRTLLSKYGQLNEIWQAAEAVANQSIDKEWQLIQKQINQG